MNMKKSLSACAAVLVLLSACDRSTTRDIEGTYAYRKGNGTAQVKLMPENRFQMLISLGRGARTMDGSYALQADTITLTNRSGDKVSGLVSDTVLYLYMGGEDMVPFRKQ
jgi:hypothetical protein